MTRSRPQNGFGAKALLSVDEAAILLGITRSTAYRAITTDTFPVPIIRVGGRWRVSREALRRLLDGKENTLAIDNNRSATRNKKYPLTPSQAQSETETCPTCGCERSTAASTTLSSSEPMCSAARRSSSGTASV